MYVDVDKDCKTTFRNKIIIARIMDVLYFNFL